MLPTLLKGVLVIPQMLLDRVVTKTEGYEVRQLEKLYALLCQTIYRHRRDYDKTALLQVGTQLTSEEINAQYHLFPCLFYCAHPLFYTFTFRVEGVTVFV